MRPWLFWLLSLSLSLMLALLVFWAISFGGVIVVYATPELGIAVQKGELLVGRQTQGRRITVLACSLLIPAALCAVPYVVWRAKTLSRHRRRSRAFATDHCATCGYDLRASAERCPECGTPLPPAVLPLPPLRTGNWRERYRRQHQ